MHNGPLKKTLQIVIDEAPSYDCVFFVGYSLTQKKVDSNVFKSRLNFWALHLLIFVERPYEK